MSKINELVRRYCPEGVEYQELSSVCLQISTGKQRNRDTLSKTRTVATSYPVINGGVAASGYTDDFNVEKDTITVSQGGASAGFVSFLTERFWSGAHCYTVEPQDENNLDNRYLYFFLKESEKLLMSKAMGAGIPGLNRKILNELKIPVPPIEIQEEIVNILDKFTQLEAELSARQRQHAHYWDYLLAPREAWKTTTLGDIAEVFDGPHATPRKTVTGPWYLSISSLKNGRVDLTESAHLGEDEYPTWTRRVAPRVGDTLFSYETRVGQAAYWDTDEPAALGRRMGLLRPRADIVHPRFLTLLYLGPQFQKLIQAKTVKGSTVDRIPIANMASWKVIIPPLDEQAEIVRQVDAFDAIVNDLSAGLPAEIRARRKQYEYYRTKLLTFQELAV